MFCVGKVFYKWQKQAEQLRYVIQQNHLGKNKAWICELVGFTILRHPEYGGGLRGGCALG
jgi:hypothetical protein